MKRKLKSIPKFKSEDDERKFWAQADTREYFDYNEAEPVIFLNLKPSTKSISIRLTESMLNELKQLANKKDVPYQSLVKVFIAEKLQEENRE